MKRAVMHCQEDLEKDLNFNETRTGLISDKVIMKWFNERYSTSKHLWVLYSLVRGLDAKTVLEIGFGRSSFVLVRAVYENGGQMIFCDKKGSTPDKPREGFYYLLSEQEKSISKFLHGRSPLAWEYLTNENNGIDFAFLDYFGHPSIGKDFCINEIKTCLSFMKTNGIIAIHDTFYDDYVINEALEEVTEQYNFTTLPYCYGLGLIRKTEDSKYGTLIDNFMKKEDANL